MQWDQWVRFFYIFHFLMFKNLLAHVTSCNHMYGCSLDSHGSAMPDSKRSGMTLKRRSSSRCLRISMMNSSWPARWCRAYFSNVGRWFSVVATDFILDIESLNSDGFNMAELLHLSMQRGQGQLETQSLMWCLCWALGRVDTSRPGAARDSQDGTNLKIPFKKKHSQQCQQITRPMERILSLFRCYDCQFCRRCRGRKLSCVSFVCHVCVCTTPTAGITLKFLDVVTFIIAWFSLQCFQRLRHHKWWL